jgi:N6-L-threonylcarbamoyladenine synthase
MKHHSPHSALILGIESSCDDSSLALMRIKNNQRELLSVQSFSHEQLLKKWGGVVPELASREHVEKLPWILRDILHTTQCQVEEITHFAVTNSPGLLGPLYTGINLAKSLTLFLECPIIPVNHLKAHLEAIHFSEQISYPYLGLLVSGGHTLLLWVCSPQEMFQLGTTLDDAAGEAFDKGGKLMGLPYPAGRVIDELAKKGNPHRFSFPISFKQEAHANLSFSGVKTSLRYFLEKHPELKMTPKMREDDSYQQDHYDLCASYQHAIVEALVLKTQVAYNRVVSRFQKDVSLVVGGGVACNHYLRQRLKSTFPQTHFVLPKYCTDNGAMVAMQASQTFDQAMIFPQCLTLEAVSRVGFPLFEASY